MLRKFRIAGEIAGLLIDPIFYGTGVPKGDGRLVGVIPGLFGNDFYLEPIRSWLSRIGYAPMRSALLSNAGCPERLRTQVQAEIDRRSSNSKRPLALIGHSRGGALARAIAGALQDRVSHLILLGSPVGELQLAVTNGQPIDLANARVNRIVAEASMFARRLLDPDCSFPQCGCAFAKDIARPLSELTAVLSVFSPDDQIVSPAACRVMDGKNLEISGTHAGLVYNRDVYREVARFLAESPR